MKTTIHLASTLLLGSLLLAAPTARAQFMKHPFYGSSGINSLFDHEYPDYTKNGNLLRHDGQYGNWWYDGHSGIDYAEVYSPILSAATGTLSYVGWWHPNHEKYYGLAMQVDHGNNYRSLYGHLSAALHGSGDWVAQGWQLGTGGTTGNSSGPHLHFEARRYVNGAWRAVDPFGWTGSFTDPWQSSTGAVSSYLYVANPTTPPPPSYGTILVDNTSPGFSKWCNAGTNCPYWWSATAGYGGSMVYTCSNGTAADYKARWTPVLQAAHLYEVKAHIPNNFATSHAARYTIHNPSGSRTVYLDQHDTYGPGAGRWVSLGTHYFSDGTAGYVEISDATYIPGNYTEPAGCARKVGVDAVKFIRRSDLYLRQFVWQGNACTEHKTVLDANGDPQWGTTTTAPCPTSAPGGGTVQTYFAYISGGKLREAMWRGDSGYAREVPIAGGQVQWNQAPNWGQVGSGTYQAQSGYVLGNTLRQHVWKDNACTEHKTPLAANGDPQWGATTTAPCLTSAPGSGAVQTYFAYTSGGKLREAMWQGGTAYTREVPIAGGQVQWGQAPSWGQAGSGGSSYQAQDGFVLP